MERGIVSVRVGLSYDLLRLSLCSMDLFCAITAQNVPPLSSSLYKQILSSCCLLLFSALCYYNAKQASLWHLAASSQHYVLLRLDSSSFFLSFHPAAISLSLSLICLSISVLLCLAPGVDLTYFGVNSVRRVGHTPAQEDKVSGGGR